MCDHLDQQNIPKKRGRLKSREQPLFIWVRVLAKFHSCDSQRLDFTFDTASDSSFLFLLFHFYFFFLPALISGRFLLGSTLALAALIAKLKSPNISLLAVSKGYGAIVLKT